MLAHHFQAITAGDANGWCLNSPVWSAPDAPNHTKISVYNISSHEIAQDYVHKIDVGPPLFTLLQPEMPMDGVKTRWCDEAPHHAPW